jgi:RimJ/RimL family protein N-acetyltransferase
MTPERIEEIKALCKTDPRALLNGSEALALEVLPVLLAEVERLSEENRRAIEVVCKCSNENVQLTAEMERLGKIREAFYDFYDPDDGISGPGGGYENIHRIFEESP